MTVPDLATAVHCLKPIAGGHCLLRPGHARGCLPIPFPRRDVTATNPDSRKARA